MRQMKIKKDGHNTIRFMVLTYMSCVCIFVIQIVLTGCSRADGASDKSNDSVGQVNERGVVMKGFVQDIEGITLKNNDFRRVLYTAKNCQLVVMALKPKEEIGAEVHKSDQFFRVEAE